MTTTTIRILACVLVSCAPLAAAGEVKNAVFTAADAEQNALVLLSTSADNQSISSATMLEFQHVWPGGKKPQKKPKKLPPLLMVNHRFTKSHSPTAVMNVRWFALEPGEYLLVEKVANPYACLTRYNSFRFTVAAGEKKYLGEFRLEGGNMVLRDEYGRDFQFFSGNAKGEKPAAFEPAAPAVELNKDEAC